MINYLKNKALKLRLSVLEKIQKFYRRLINNYYTVYNEKPRLIIGILSTIILLCFVDYDLFHTSNLYYLFIVIYSLVMHTLIRDIPDNWIVNCIFCLIKALVFLYRYLRTVLMIITGFLFLYYKIDKPYIYLIIPIFLFFEYIPKNWIFACVFNLIKVLILAFTRIHLVLIILIFAGLIEYCYSQLNLITG